MGECDCTNGCEKCTAPFNPNNVIRYQDRAGHEVVRADDYDKLLKLAQPSAEGDGELDALKAARAFKGVWLHDAECFSMDGSKPCVCGREQLVKQLDAAIQARDAAIRENHEKDAQLNILRECEIHRKELIAQLAEGDGWIAEPTEQGWWWHIGSDTDLAPFMHGILRSGTNGKMFIQYPDSRWCSDVGGLWAKATPPALPAPPVAKEGRES